MGVYFISTQKEVLKIVRWLISEWRLRYWILIYCFSFTTLPFVLFFFRFSFLFPCFGGLVRWIGDSCNFQPTAFCTLDGLCAQSSVYLFRKPFQNRISNQTWTLQLPRILCLALLNLIGTWSLQVLSISANV